MLHVVYTVHVTFITKFCMNMYKTTYMMCPMFSFPASEIVQRYSTAISEESTSSNTEVSVSVRS